MFIINLLGDFQWCNGVFFLLLRYIYISAHLKILEWPYSMPRPQFIWKYVALFKDFCKPSTEVTFLKFKPWTKHIPSLFFFLMEVFGKNAAWKTFTNWKSVCQTINMKCSVQYCANILDKCGKMLWTFFKNGSVKHSFS